MSLGDRPLSQEQPTTMGVHNQVTQPCLEADTSIDHSFDGSASRQTIPRRNLTEAFEELYVEPPISGEATTPANRDLAASSVEKTSSDESPICVADLVTEAASSTGRDSHEGGDAHSASGAASPSASLQDQDVEGFDLPHFQLHSSLQRDLSQALLNRVSSYGVIHDINREANSIATSDTSSFARSCSDESRTDEEFSPIVVAANMASSRPLPVAKSIVTDTAVIDEEKWLLAAIESRGDDESRSVAACPPTFLQAMGEREYERPMDSSRTQLWKPSRSWWEAKSGKNPWIEPESHNKRWRYLWPLIHYHKFLAKCIKKLKRNGVDVKTTVSPVSVFLREEVCAVSDHLASVSLFTSQEWMECLSHFNGWTDHSPKAEDRLRRLISRLALRSLGEPGDVVSPLLRSQVDEHFLRAMASAREHMTHGGIQQERANLSKNAGHEASGDKTPIRKGDPSSRNKIPLHPQRASQSSKGATYSMAKTSSPPGSSFGKAGDGQRWGYSGHGGHWWANGWPQYAYCDENSVQSGLSGESYVQQFPDYGMYHGANGAYFPSPQDLTDYYYGGYPQYPGEHGMTPGWIGHLQVGAVEGPNYGAPPGTPSHSSPHNYNFYHDATGPDQTPHRTPYDPQMPSSPYWAHLDHVTLAMSGLATPHGKPPETPQRVRGQVEEDEAGKDVTPEQSKPPDDFVANAKPLLINNQSQYYQYGSYRAREGFVPPSPATQFMMSPQASSQAAAYYAHTYGSSAYGASPRRQGWRQPQEVPKNTLEGVPSSNEHNAGDKPEKDDVTPPQKVTAEGAESVSSATVETMAESESIGPNE